MLDCAPLEGVGLLATLPDKPDGEGALHFYPGTNVDASASRYTMEPAEVLAAFRDIEVQGWRFGAIAHSHLRSPATPSATDLREAYYPETLMVIVSLACHPPEIRAWWLCGPPGAATAAREVGVVVQDAGAPARPTGAGKPGLKHGRETEARGKA
ncbi:MAG: M67 family metallopeptidase [Chloroflexota bacterium]|nr:M67 family metallopeptidase [Chloroflexota bacterium]